MTIGTSIGAGVLIGTKLSKDLKKEETTILITADGTLVTVDTKNISKKSGKKASNKDLENWMNSNT